MEWITVADLTAFAKDIDTAKAEQMIGDAQAVALLAAPCLAELTDETKLRALKAILRGAILRWEQSGAGAYTQHTTTTGAMSVSESYDTRNRRSGMFWPSEIEQLQSLCSGAPARGAAYMINMTGFPASGANPLTGAVINSNLGTEPMGTWSDEMAPVVEWP